MQSILQGGAVISASVFYIVSSTGFALAAAAVAAATAMMVKNWRAQQRAPVMTVEAKVSRILEAPDSTVLFYAPDRSGAARCRAEFLLADNSRKTFRIPKNCACAFDLGEIVVISYQGYQLLEVRKKEAAGEGTRFE